MEQYNLYLSFCVKDDLLFVPCIQLTVFCLQSFNLAIPIQDIDLQQFIFKRYPMQT